MNITERFFRAIGWRNLNKKDIKKAYKYFSDIGDEYAQPDERWWTDGKGRYLDRLPGLPNITQSWPDFKKYVIPVMRKKGHLLHLSPQWCAWVKDVAIPPKQVEIKNDEILLAAVEAAVEVMEEQNHD